MRTLDEWVSALREKGLKPTRSNGELRWTSRCPCHDDKRPSLSIRQGDSQPVVGHCFAGCRFEDIAAKLFSAPASPARRVRVVKVRKAASARRVAAAYDYRNERGRLLFQAVRYRPKDFRQRRQDGKGGWIWDLKGVRFVLYGLPGLLAAIKRGATIYVTEGEKDADAINAVGLSGVFATTSPMGAGKWREEYAETLRKAARVLVWADADKPGREHARTVAASLAAIGVPVEIIEAREGKDAADHLAAGLGLNDVVFRDRLTAEPLGDVLRRDPLPTPWAVPGLIAESDIVLVSGPGGCGKTWMVLSMALALATGHDVFGHYSVTRPYRVAVVDLESRPWEADQRLYRIAKGNDLRPGAISDRVMVVRERIRLDRPDDLRRLIVTLRAWGTEVLILDSFRRLFAGDENKSEIVSGLFVNALDQIRNALNCAVIITDHTRKRTGEPDLDAVDQALRGSTDKRNMADAHVGVEPLDEGLSFVPTKTRHSRLPDPVRLEIGGLDADSSERDPVWVGYVGPLDRTSDRVQDAVLAVLADEEDGLLRRDIVERVPFSLRSVEAALSALVRRDKIVRRKEGKASRYIARKPDARNVRGRPLADDEAPNNLRNPLRGKADVRTKPPGEGRKRPQPAGTGPGDTSAPSGAHGRTPRAARRSQARGQRRKS